MPHDDYDYDDMYAPDDADASPPWEIGRPQPALEKEFAATSGLGRVLDAGCGTGELSLYLAERCEQVVGFDISPVAIDKARGKASACDVDNVEFVVADATDLPSLQSGYDLIVDSGLLHSLDEPACDGYLRNLRWLANPGSHLVILAASLAAEQGWGFDRLTLTELVTAHGWQVDSVDETELYAEMGEQQFHLPAFLARATAR